MAQVQIDAPPSFHCPKQRPRRPAYRGALGPICAPSQPAWQSARYIEGDRLRLGRGIAGISPPTVNHCILWIRDIKCLSVDRAIRPSYLSVNMPL